VAALAAAGVVAAAPASAAGSFEVSTGWADITPPVGYPLAGYGWYRESDGINEPLAIRCTILWDSGTPNVLVTADVLGFGRAMHQQIRSEVIALGVASADFVLVASHTHNGPVLIEKLDPYMAYGITDQTSIQDYSSDLVTAIVGLVDETLNAPRSACTLDYKVLSANFSWNRESLGYVERDVPTLVARDLDGDPRAVLFSYGTHTVAGGPGTEFDPDYPSEAIKTIEALGPDVHAQFILGPAGDQEPLGEHSIALSDNYGAALGTVIVNAIGTPGRAIQGPVVSTLTERSLPLDITDTPSNLQAVRNIYAQRSVDPGLEAYKQRHAQVMMNRIDLHVFQKSVPLPIQSWKFSGGTSLSMVFSGGEVVSGYAAYFRNKYGGSNRLWFAAYANEVPGYIPSDELLQRVDQSGKAVPSYAAGIDSDYYKGVAGGSMCAYGHMGHFVGRPPGSSVVGVEQIMIAGIESVL